MTQKTDLKTGLAKAATTCRTRMAALDAEIVRIRTGDTSDTARILKLETERAMLGRFCQSADSGFYLEEINLFGPLPVTFPDLRSLAVAEGRMKFLAAAMTSGAGWA